MSYVLKHGMKSAFRSNFGKVKAFYLHGTCKEIRLGLLGLVTEENDRVAF